MRVSAGAAEDAKPTDPARGDLATEVQILVDGSLRAIPPRVDAAARLQGWKQAATERALHQATRRTLLRSLEEGRQAAKALSAEVESHTEERLRQAQEEVQRATTALSAEVARHRETEERLRRAQADYESLQKEALHTEAQIRTLVAEAEQAVGPRLRSQRLVWLEPVADRISRAAGTLPGSQTWRVAGMVKRVARPLAPGDMTGAARTLLERAEQLKSTVGSAGPLLEIEAAAGSLLEIIGFLRGLKAYRLASAVKGVSDAILLRGAALGVLEYLQRQVFELVDRLKVLQAEDESTASGRLSAEIHDIFLPVFDEPEVSIVIPVHNQHRFTFNCLRAVLLNSGTTPYEVIVVDDKSSDETEATLSRVRGVRVIRNPVNEGFVLSCQRGAEAAKGRYLVFLNNDTLPRPGWLDELIATFRDQPGAGLVGAKLLNADGTLQEAGGIVWADGSSWNYGRGFDPEMPEFNYVREVDYCSGACIAVPKDLFFAVGGFDRRYVPAYFEDTDLALTVAQTGRAVLYQPRCEVIHFDGMTQRHTGAKQYMERNAGLFADKWKGVLAGRRPRGLDPDFEKDRGVRGRVLVIDHYIPRPDQDSGSMRMFGILRLLASMGLKVTFAPENLHRHNPYARPLQTLGIETLYAPQISSVADYIQSSANVFDMAILSRFDIAPKYIDLLRQTSPLTRVVFDTVDLASLRSERLADLTGSAADRATAAKLREQELILARKADVTLVVSEVEHDLLKTADPSLDVRILSNIHETEGAIATFEERSGVLFIGGYDHPPNIDAVVHFVQDILPRVRAAIPGLKFYVIGSRPPASVISLASDDVIVLGHVPDGRPYFEACRLSVAPLRYGAGVKGKVNQSLSFGVPVVATPVAVEAMYLVHGEDVLVAEDPEAFAKAMIRAYTDSALWNRLSRNGLANIERHFSPEVARQALEGLLTDLVS